MCGKMYDIHYNKRLRPKGTTSALLFGVAMDEALNALLLKTGDPVEVFKENFTYEMCKDIRWFKADLDPEILTEEQLNKVKGKSEGYITWACMRVKGRMLIEQYIEQIIPLITEVHDVQLETTRPGFIDAILSLRGYGMVLIDHKTSSRYYKRDAVTSSSQLALYAKQTGLSKAGFIVLHKQINKNKVKTCRDCGSSTTTSHKTCNQTVAGVRCHGGFDILLNPQALIQVIVDDIPVATQDAVEKSVQQTEKAIAAGSFPMNLNQCDNVFGRRCPYYDLCRTGDKTGLEKAKERVKKK